MKISGEFMSSIWSAQMMGRVPGEIALWRFEVWRAFRQAGTEDCRQCKAGEFVGGIFLH